MDERGLKTKDIAAVLQVDEATVRNWRSQGVPKRRMPHVQKFMDEWQPAGSQPPTSRPIISNVAVQDFKASGQNLVLNPEPEVFNAWTAAFKHSPAETLEEWAIDGLTKLAAGQPQTSVRYSAEPLPELKVAEDPTPYGQDKVSGGN
jgi:hypothetical protein